MGQCFTERHPQPELELEEKLKCLDYPDFSIAPGQENILMLYMQDKLICSVNYALSLSDEDLKALIDETIEQVE